MLLGPAEQGFSIAKRAKYALHMIKKANIKKQELDKEAWSWGGAGSGALSYGSTGAMIGSMILPGWGTAIGGGLGALLGGVMGGLGGGEAEPTTEAGTAGAEKMPAFDANELAWLKAKNIDPQALATGKPGVGAAGGSNVASGSSNYGMQNDLLQKATGMTGSQLEAMSRYAQNQRMTRSFLRRVTRGTEFAGADLGSYTPEQIATLPPEIQPTARRMVEMRQARTSAAGGRGLAQYSSGFNLQVPAATGQSSMPGTTTPLTPGVAPAAPAVPTMTMPGQLAVGNPVAAPNSALSGANSFVQGEHRSTLSDDSSATSAAQSVV
jgi:hypothetical protein